VRGKEENDREPGKQLPTRRCMPRAAVAAVLGLRQIPRITRGTTRLSCRPSHVALQAPSWPPSGRQIIGAVLRATRNDTLCYMRGQKESRGNFRGIQIQEMEGAGRPLNPPRKMLIIVPPNLPAGEAYGVFRMTSEQNKYGMNADRERKPISRQRGLPVPCAVNDGIDPDAVLLHSVHDSVRAVDDFPAIETADFWDHTTDFRLFFETIGCFEQPIDEKGGVVDGISRDVRRDCVDIVQGAGRPDYFCHFASLFRASSSETPFPARISRSPRSNLEATYRA